MFASFAYAGFFPPASSMGTSWFDGSVIWDLDIFSVVNKCMETHAQSDIVVDVVMTSQKTLKTVDASNYNSVEMLWRFLEVQRYYSVMDGLLRAQFAYPDITFRHIISPSESLPSSLYPLVSNQVFNNFIRIWTKVKLTQWYLLGKRMVWLLLKLALPKKQPIHFTSSV